jgi:hypothetical protein
VSSQFTADSGYESHDDRLAPIVRWALREQVRGQEPSPAAWQGIQARLARRAARHRHFAVRWATLAPTVVVCILMLSYSLWPLSLSLDAPPFSPQQEIALASVTVDQPHAPSQPVQAAADAQRQVDGTPPSEPITIVDDVSRIEPPPAAPVQATDAPVAPVARKVVNDPPKESKSVEPLIDDALPQRPKKTSRPQLPVRTAPIVHDIRWVAHAVPL